MWKITQEDLNKAALVSLLGEDGRKVLMRTFTRLFDASSYTEGLTLRGDEVEKIELRLFGLHWFLALPPVQNPALLLDYELRTRTRHPDSHNYFYKYDVSGLTEVLWDCLSNKGRDVVSRNLSRLAAGYSYSGTKFDQVYTWGVSEIFIRDERDPIIFKFAKENPASGLASLSGDWTLWYERPLWGPHANKSDSEAIIHLLRGDFGYGITVPDPKIAVGTSVTAEAFRLMEKIR